MAKKEKKEEEEATQNEDTSPSTKVEQIIKLYQENPTLSYREIAKRVKTTEGYVANVISRHLGKAKGEVPKELEPLDELDYLRRIIIATWGNSQKAELIISLFRDHDPNNLKILYSLLNKAQCPKTAQELIIYSWAKHRHIAPDEIKEMFKGNKSILRTFRELGYFEYDEDFEEEEEEIKAKDKEEEKENIEDLLDELKKEKLKELKKRLEELRLKKELRELEKQLGEYEEKNKEDEFDFGGGNEMWDVSPAPPQPVTRKVIRPAINPATGEVLRDDKGNIIFETVEEPVDGSAPANQMDDMMRWMLALQQTKKEDPEKELLKKELEELKRKMEEEERRRKEEEERKRYEEQIKQMQEQMQKFQEQVMQMIQAMQEQGKKGSETSFEQQLLLKLLEEKDRIPPEVMQVINEEREIIKKLQEKPRDDEEKKMLMKQIEELRKTLEKKELEGVFSKYNQYITTLYQKIESLEKELSNKYALSDEKYKIDKIIEMDKDRLNTTKDIIDKATESILGPTMKIALEQMKQQDMMNRYMMLLQEEQRRGLPPGTLIDRFFGTPKVTEDEKRKILEKIDEEMKEGE